MSQGEHVAALEAGIFRRKTWLHSGIKGDPRDWHQAMDGETVGIEERFSNGLQHPREWGAPAVEVINCGCSVTYAL